MLHESPVRAVATLLATTALAVTASVASAETLFLKNGRSIIVDRYWEEGDQIFYERNGSTFGFPRSLLDRVDRTVPHPTSGDDDKTTGYRNEIASETISEARESARDGNVRRATSLYEKAIEKAPDEITPRIELAELHLARGDTRAAQRELEYAKRLDPESARIRELLGDVYYRRGRTGLAIREWQTALSSEPSPGLLYKLKQALRENDEDINFDEVERPKFVIRYDGQVNEAIGRVVAAALDEEYYQLEREFRFSPDTPIEITLYTNREFQDVTHAPSWASALNDGEIRIPVEGITELTPRLRRVVRHELTHSFVNEMTGGNCPAWFHEGLAQMREGSGRGDPYPRLQEARANGSLLPLWSLEGSLVNYSRDQALLVYAQSLAATEYVTARRGRAALVRILERLARRQTMNDALKAVVGLDYQEFQTAWEADLARFRPRAR